jgi:hypothetical protein
VEYFLRCCGIWSLMDYCVVLKIMACGLEVSRMTLLSSSKENSIYELMQNAMHLVQRWCEQVGLSVNPNVNFVDSDDEQ